MSITKQLEAELSQLESAGLLNPQAIVNWAAMHEDSALHAEFEWDNRRAGAEYRVIQARELIQRVKIEIQVGDDKLIRVRKYSSLPSNRGQDGGYSRTEEVLADKRQRDELLRVALTELNTLRKKYEHLQELAQVFAALDAVKSVAA